jgi:type IV pilus assembly protein PilV
MKKKNGFLIFEVLIAVLIFSIGILGVLDYQKKSISSSINNQNRVIAINYANKLSNLILLDGNNINSYINGTSTKYQDWLNEVKINLPYVQEKEPLISLTELDGNQMVSITIYWKNSSSSNFSNYTVKIGII